MEKKVEITDTTLRDGQQSPWAWMTYQQNIEYAKMIANAMRWWDHILEAWFPSASNTEWRIVNDIAKETSWIENSPKISSLSQLKEEQIEQTIKALEPAKSSGKGRIHTFFPVDPILMEASVWIQHSDHKKKNEIIEKVFKLCKLAKDEDMEVQFSPEGYSRMQNNWKNNFDFVTQLIKASIEWGARIINCPDTIWEASRFEEDYFINQIKRHNQIIQEAYGSMPITWSVHCHDDFWLAVANSKEALFDPESPVTQVEWTINWVGERAGNASIEEIVMIINHFGNKHWIYTEFDLKSLKKLSDFVATYMLPRQPHKAIVWDNASTHSSGIHVNAIEKDPTSYQPFDPKKVWSKITTLFGPSSGSNHAKKIIEKSGYSFPEEKRYELFHYIKDYWQEKRKGITDEELMEAFFEYIKPIKIQDIDYSKQHNKDGHTVSVFVEWDIFGEKTIENTIPSENSPLYALKAKLDEFVSWYDITNYQSHSEGKWADAVSVSNIEISNWWEYVWKWKDKDIEKSALKALIEAYNNAYIQQKYKK